MSFLDEILADMRHVVDRRKQLWPLERLQAQLKQVPPPLDFIAALGRGTAENPSHSPALIAEIKCASPSRGVLAADFDPRRLARIYAQNGASAVSVLTNERYFNGHLNHLRQAAYEVKESLPEARQLPLLRKDFILDPYQVYEARWAGADAVLLIAAALAPDQLSGLQSLAQRLGMAALVEIHSRQELEMALDCGPVLLGINNRSLKDFTVDLETTLNLRHLVPSGVCLVSESGIHTPEDVLRLASAGVDAVLVGEALVSAPDTAAKVRTFTRLPSMDL